MFISKSDRFFSWQIEATTKFRIYLYLFRESCVFRSLKIENSLSLCTKIILRVSVNHEAGGLLVRTLVTAALYRLIKMMKFPFLFIQFNIFLIKLVSWTHYYFISFLYNVCPKRLLLYIVVSCGCLKRSLHSFRRSFSLLFAWCWRFCLHFLSQTPIWVANSRQLPFIAQQ